MLTVESSCTSLFGPIEVKSGHWYAGRALKRGQENMAGNGRVILAVGLIGAMLVALFVVLTSGEDEAPSAATTVASTATLPPTSTTTAAPPAGATTTSVDPDPRLAEVEAILEGLELARLVAIYNRDEAALPSIIAIRAGIDDAVAVFETLEFVDDPREVGIDVTALEVLLDRPDCLVVLHEFDGRKALGPAAVETAVRVLWPKTAGEQDYRLVRLRSSASDLWQDDCDLMDRGEVP